MAFVPYVCWLSERKCTRRKNTVVTNSTTPCDSRIIHKLSWEEIDKATESFGTVIGEGGFSTVYRAVLADRTICAVKVQTRKTERLRQAYTQELHALLRARHAHLVKLLAYCDDRESGALVFEYASNGNLHERLHSDNGFLPWPRRVAIAMQIASGLQYLHEVCDPPIVHCDIKSSNILLDRNYNAKLCDFGFCKTGDKNYLSKSCVMGSPGYIDPHCFKTGIVTKKSDVYSFGVILLELITGMEAFCNGNEREIQLLPVFASSFLKDPNGLFQIVDYRLDGRYESKQVQSMADIAVLCISGEPELRPSMTEIVTLMNG